MTKCRKEEEAKFHHHIGDSIPEAEDEETSSNRPGRIYEKPSCSRIPTLSHSDPSYVMALFEKRPELKYRGDDVVLYHIPKGTNLLTLMLMGQPIAAALPDLLPPGQVGATTISQSTLTSSSLAQDTLGGKRGGGIPEEGSVHVWIPRALALDDWGDDTSNPKKQKRRNVILSITLVLLVITIAIATALGVLLLRDGNSNSDDPNNVDTNPIVVPGHRPILSSTRSPITRYPMTGRPRPSKLQKLQDMIVSLVVMVDGIAAAA
eukprot:CAMPEP_0202000110 /NCGR_PEP_ID=MMETSP0905-20130828/6518_1 /ASSEMBLY_ACC=CAM_ASM_000554 /TAXON_ID=420261 /ORGANISM="Thalassiosira antarctica, Strain CCMP982" /LENGTH=262 /DNA_ID=CAMNT_0048556481 /DNA_START=240 /DNA_END=1024 /DNA_ORIENTATION=+